MKVGSERKLPGDSAGKVSSWCSSLQVSSLFYYIRFQANAVWMLGIGSQLVAKGLKDCQRLALKRLAPYLKTVRKMIKTLGRNVLDEYCRDEHLSKEKILELENLEARLPEERSGSDGEEEDEEEEDESEGEY